MTTLEELDDTSELRDLIDNMEPSTTLLSASTSPFFKQPKYLTESEI